MGQRLAARGPYRVLALALGLVILGACTTPDEGGGDIAPKWEEPGWMAQVRQQDEAHQTAMLACYAEHGLEGTPTGGGIVGFVFESDDPSQPDVKIPPAVQKLIDVASADCNARVPLAEHHMSKALDDAAYERLIDLRDCILARGHDVPEPPSAETWKDSDLPEAWNPYEATFTGPSRKRIGYDELRSLMEACPQSGPTYFYEVRADSAP